MGGNVVDSLPGRESRWAGTLLGPEGAATVKPGSLVAWVSACGWFPSVPGSEVGGRSAAFAWWRCAWLLRRFGGVFVNWIVDASI